MEHCIFFIQLSTARFIVHPHKIVIILNYLHIFHSTESNLRSRDRAIGHCKFIIQLSWFFNFYLGVAIVNFSYNCQRHDSLYIFHKIFNVPNYLHNIHSSGLHFLLCTFFIQLSTVRFIIIKCIM